MERASFLCKDGPILTQHLPQIDELSDGPFATESTSVQNAIIPSDKPAPESFRAINSGKFYLKVERYPGNHNQRSSPRRH